MDVLPFMYLDLSFAVFPRFTVCNTFAEQCLRFPLTVYVYNKTLDHGLQSVRDHAFKYQ